LRVVEQGVFKDGKVIAIKRLRFMSSSDDNQFQNEFEHLKRLKHQNIVQLVGFCDEEEEVCVPFEGKMVHAVEIHRALCLEFVPNGGLAKFLSGMLVI
jgi:coatomer subunit beta'